MTTALPPSGAPSTPPLNGHYSSPKISRESGKTPPPLKDNSTQPLIKTLKVFLDANLSQAPSEAKKINGHVEQIPSVTDILKMIVERKDEIIREESPELIKDINGFYKSVIQLIESPHSSSLVNFALIDALYSIAHSVGDLKLSDLHSSYKSFLINHCADLSSFYRRKQGENGNYFLGKQLELIKQLAKNR